jgi:hypothetical protein
VETTRKNMRRQIEIDARIDQTITVDNQSIAWIEHRFPLLILFIWDDAKRQTTPFVQRFDCTISASHKG